VSDTPVLFISALSESDTSVATLLAHSMERRMLRDDGTGLLGAFANFQRPCIMQPVELGAPWRINDLPLGAFISS
jgi:hypothetical protein